MTKTWWAALVLALAAVSAQSGAKTHSKNSHSTYVVRNGDCDWTIANRLDITVRALHQMNPEVRWSSLQPGEKLALPGRKATSETHGTSSHHSSKSEAHVSGGGHYIVRQDDNDWTIAAKLGVAIKVLHRLNPNTNWSRIHPGEKLVVPGNVASKSIRGIHTRYARVTSDDVTLRRGPGTDHDSVTTVDEGTTARVLDHENGWYKLRFPKGTIAWVRGDFLTAYHESSSSGRRSHRYAYSSRRRHHGHTPEVALAADEVGGDNPAVSDAVGMRGTRYSYGSSSRHGTDCSGLTMQVYARHGVHLPRTAREQSQVGQRVGKDGLKKGDLVFFHTGRSDRVNHVGMYVGNGKFVHASSGGGKVQVNSLNDGYYSRRFVGARRVAKGASKK